MIATLTSMSRPKKAPTEAVRLEIELVRQARMVAAEADISVPELLADLLRGPLAQRYQAVAEKLAKEAASRKKSG